MDQLLPGGWKAGGRNVGFQPEKHHNVSLDRRFSPLARLFILQGSYAGNISCRRPALLNRLSRHHLTCRGVRSGLGVADKKD